MNINSEMLRHVVWQQVTDVSQMIVACITKPIMMEAVIISETSLDFCLTTLCNI